MSSSRGPNNAFSKLTGPGWEYGEKRDPNDENLIWCKLCGSMTGSGIFRFKPNLMGGHRSAKKCALVTLETSKKIPYYMNESKKNKEKITKEMERTENLFGLHDEDDEAKVEKIGNTRAAGISIESKRSYQELTVSLLQKQVEKIEEYREQHKTI